MNFCPPEFLKGKTLKKFKQRKKQKHARRKSHASLFGS
jgi:hypothetical protein